MAALLLMLILTLLAGAAAAGYLYSLEYCFSRPEVNWKTLGVKKGAKLPVFSAPFEEAWRGAKGKAAVSVSEPFRVLASLQDGEWLMVEYTVDRGNGRVGWIRTPEGSDITAHATTLSIARLACETDRACVLTDDPRGGQREIRTMEAGERVIAMAEVQTEGTLWAYVETEIDGQPAWGFLDREALREVSPFRAEGDCLVFEEDVTRIGAYWENYDENGDPEPISSLRAGEIWVESVPVFDLFGKSIRHVALPGGLKGLSTEAFSYATLAELRLPDGLDSFMGDALFGCRVDRLILPASFTADRIQTSSRCTLGAWEVEAGNPVYASRDGVLFSADGKTLISYPNGRKETHYDVPAGTEVIGRSAFSDDNMEIPLQTLSLPIGLRRIEAWAFSGCGRLNSLTVPLTVTELDPSALAQCVSLERLSLPPGLTVELDEDTRTWAQWESFSAYTGDNGVTRPAPLRDEYSTEPYDPNRPAIVTYEVWVSGENGEDPVPVYASPEAAESTGELPSGERHWVSQTAAGRAQIGHDQDGNEIWIPLEALQPCCSDVFFSLWDLRLVPDAAGEAALVRAGLPPQCAAFLDEETLTAHFYLEQGEDRQALEATLPLSQVRLFRPGADDGRRFGLLLPAAEGQPIRLLDAPAGNPVAWTYIGDQAEALDSRDGWVYVRTGQFSGWVPEAQFAEVYPEEAGDATD